MRTNNAHRKMKDGELNMWIYFNANPLSLDTNDCTIRAICAVSGLSWDTVHDRLCEISKEMCTVPSTNAVFWAMLRELGYNRSEIIEHYPKFYTVADFAHDHPKGKYVLGPHEHAVAVIDGDWYDTFDSGGTIPLYYFYRQKDGR